MTCTRICLSVSPFASNGCDCHCSDVERMYLILFVMMDPRNSDIIVLCSRTVAYEGSV